jgi:aminopeptidase N
MTAGRRMLRNTAMALRVDAGHAGADEAAAARFRHADNMTDRLAAVSALAQSASPHREGIIDAFGREFADEPLVMDKWLMLQATMHRQPGDAPVLERVRALMLHPAYSPSNPNKLRALVVAFCGGNLAEFHRLDGEGYRFWTERVLELDVVNPQVAARLARCLDRWRKFDAPRQRAMQAALEAVRDRAQSPDVLEVVGKALA